MICKTHVLKKSNRKFVEIFLLTRDAFPLHALFIGVYASNKAVKGYANSLASLLSFKTSSGSLETGSVPADKLKIILQFWFLKATTLSSLETYQQISRLVWKIHSYDKQLQQESLKQSLAVVRKHSCCWHSTRLSHCCELKVPHSRESDGLFLRSQLP